MDIKHSPGPWKIGFYDGSGKGTITSDGAPIVRLHWGCSCCDNGEDSLTDEDKANAALIAAAPDLLEIAHRLMAMPVNLRDKQWEPLIRSCKAAIDKTEGK